MELKPDWASLNAGSMNFGRNLFPNLPEVMELYARKMKEIKVMPEFEAYDLSMIQNVDVSIRGRDPGASLQLQFCPRGRRRHPGHF